MLEKTGLGPEYRRDETKARLWEKVEEKRKNKIHQQKEWKEKKEKNRTSKKASSDKQQEAQQVGTVSNVILITL